MLSTQRLHAMLTGHRGLCAEFLAAPKTQMWTGGMGLDLVGMIISCASGRLP